MDACEQIKNLNQQNDELKNSLNEAIKSHEVQEKLDNFETDAMMMNSPTNSDNSRQFNRANLQ